MRILAVDRSALYFGSAINLTQWAKRYVDGGSDVDLLLAEHGAFEEEASKVGVGVSVVPLPDYLNSYGKKNLKLLAGVRAAIGLVFYNFKLLRSVDVGSYDLIVSNNYRTYVYFILFFLYARLFLGRKTILRYQTSDTPLRGFRVISPKVFSSVIVHGTPGYARASFGDAFVQSDNVFSLPNPVNTDVFSPGLEGKGRGLLGVPEGAFVFLSVSYIEPRKGVAELVAAFSELGLENTYLVHVGDCGEHYEYESRVKGLASENTIFLGRRTDIADLMREADAFVLYSEYEGMPYVVVEAMASGLPVVASGAGSNVEVLDGVGVVVEWGDEMGLKRSLRAIHNDKLGVLASGQKARTRVIERYSLERYFKSLKAIYGDLGR